MNILITARKFKAHDSLKSFIKDEVASLEKFNYDIINADVILSFQNVNNNSIKTTEIILQVPGQTISANASTEDFKKSISASVAKLERQLKKLKTKRTVRTR